MPSATDHILRAMGNSKHGTYTVQYWWILSDNLKWQWFLPMLWSIYTIYCTLYHIRHSDNVIWLWFLPMLWSMYTIYCTLYYIRHSNNLIWLWFLPMLWSMYPIYCNLYYIYSYTLTDSMSAKMNMEGKINYNYNYNDPCVVPMCSQILRITDYTTDVSVLLHNILCTNTYPWGLVTSCAWYWS